MLATIEVHLRAYRPLIETCYFKVLVLTHEATAIKDTDDYFARKFYPAVPFFVMSRSYKMPPQLKPDQTLFDCWKDLFVLTRSTPRKNIHVFCR